MSSDRMELPQGTLDLAWHKLAATVGQVLETV